MNKKTGLIGILVLVILFVAVSAYAFNNNPYVQPIGDKSTKLALYNNNTNVWLHVDLQLEQVIPENGKKKTFYLDNIVKPNGKVTIDLSKILGYGNKKLPVGDNHQDPDPGKDSITPTAEGKSNLNMNLQGSVQYTK